MGSNEQDPLQRLADPAVLERLDAALAAFDLPEGVSPQSVQLSFQKDVQTFPLAAFIAEARDLISRSRSLSGILTTREMNHASVRADLVGVVDGGKFLVRLPDGKTQLVIDPLRPGDRRFQLDSSSFAQIRSLTGSAVREEVEKLQTTPGTNAVADEFTGSSDTGADIVRSRKLFKETLAQAVRVARWVDSSLDGRLRLLYLPSESDKNRIFYELLRLARICFGDAVSVTLSNRHNDKVECEVFTGVGVRDLVRSILADANRTADIPGILQQKDTQRKGLYGMVFNAESKFVGFGARDLFYGDKSRAILKVG